MVDLKKFAEQLVNLTVKEVNELTNILKTEHNIEPAATPVVVANGNPQGVDTKPAEVKTSFDVMLTSVGTSKLAVVKLVKDATRLGIKEAKELVDAAPKIIMEALAKEQAEELKKKLEEAGAEVELK